MSTAQATNSKTTYRRLQDAINTGEPEIIPKTVDEVVAPDAQLIGRDVGH